MVKYKKSTKIVFIILSSIVAILMCVFGIQRCIHFWQYKSCNTKYISISQYKGLKIKKEKEKKITEDAVDFALTTYLQKENLKQHDTQSVIKSGDTICLNYTGRYNGSSFRNSDVKGLIITLGNGSIDPTFEKQLIGNKPENIFKVKMTLPTNYSDDFVAGQEVVFNVQVDYILKSVEVPSVVSDDFIKKYTGYSTLAEYKKFVKNDLKKTEKLRCEKINRANAIKALLKKTKIIKYPSKELKSLETALIEKDNSNALYSNVSEKEYRTNMGYTSDKKYKEHITTLAKEQLKEQLIVDAITKANNLEVPDDFSQQEQKKLADELGFDSVNDMNAGMVKNEIRLTIKKNFVADYLLKWSK